MTKLCAFLMKASGACRPLRYAFANPSILNLQLACPRFQLHVSGCTFALAPLRSLSNHISFIVTFYFLSPFP